MRGHLHTAARSGTLVALVVLGVLVSCVSLVTPSQAADLVPGTWQRVDNRPDGTAPTRGSGIPALSADGRYTVFSATREIVGGAATDHVAQIWLHDAVSDTDTLVSRTDHGFGGDADSHDPSISNNGRYVSYSTAATNLPGGGDTYGDDVYRFNRVTGANRLITTVPRNPTGLPRYAESTISATGRFVSFVTNGQLVADDTNIHDDAYVWDGRTGTTTLVSRTADGQVADRASYWSDVSVAGDVVFTSSATNLVPGANPTGRLWLSYLWSPGAGSPILVSQTPDLGPRSSGRPSISDDGRYVCFPGSSDLDALDNRLYSYSTRTGSVQEIVDPNRADWYYTGGDMSYGGRFVLTVATRFSGDLEVDTEVWDRVTGRFETLTTSDHLTVRRLSADGRHLAAWSYADELVTAPDGNDQPDAFVWSPS